MLAYDDCAEKHEHYTSKYAISQLICKKCGRRKTPLGPQHSLRFERRRKMGDLKDVISRCQILSTGTECRRPATILSLYSSIFTVSHCKPSNSKSTRLSRWSLRTVTDRDTWRTGAINCTVAVSEFEGFPVYPLSLAPCWQLFHSHDPSFLMIPSVEIRRNSLCNLRLRFWVISSCNLGMWLRNAYSIAFLINPSCTTSPISVIRT